MRKAERETGRLRKPSPKVRRLPNVAEPEDWPDAPTANRHAELLRLERKQFTQSGRNERVQRALEALAGLRLSFNLDAGTVRWLAQDADLAEF